MDKCKNRGAVCSCDTRWALLWQTVFACFLGLISISDSVADEKTWPDVPALKHDSESLRTTFDGWQAVGSGARGDTHVRSDSNAVPDAVSDKRVISSASGGAAGADGWYKTTASGESADSIPNQGSQSSALTVDTQEVQTLTLPPIRNTSASPETVNLDLFVGEVKVLEKVDVKRVAIGNGSIVRAEVIDTGELLIIAAGAGSSSLRLWNADGTQSDFNIRVSETDRETRVHMQRTVRMRVRMVEFRKSALGRLGIDWSDSTTGPGLAVAGDAVGNNLFRPEVQGFAGLPMNVAPFSTYFGIASNITSRINFLAQNGDAVTLAEPVLSAMNGGEASFLAGGEVPYPSIGENGLSQVEFKEYGVKLNVAPLIDSAGNVRAKLETEISQLDASVSVQGTPGLLTRRAQTEVTVRSGETIVISGLLSSESSTDTDMLPGLGRLPIVGRFFSSEGQRNGVSELVIFITPEVIEPGQAVINARERIYFNESDKRINTVRQQLPLME